MEIINVLSYLGGYFGSSTFTLDMNKVEEISEYDSDELISELTKLQSSGDIKVSLNNSITLVNIKPQVNEEFNDLYKSVETFEWKKGTKLVLDKK